MRNPVDSLQSRSASPLRLGSRLLATVRGVSDTFGDRSELEAMARRYIIPYIDIGMDVHKVEDHFVIGGQVILSMPGRPCLRCVGFLRDEFLAEEPQQYGAAGGRPQVVWSNGVLASLAVGLFMQIVSPWHEEHRMVEYVEFDGNQGLVARSNRLAHVSTQKCMHFEGADNLGDPFWLSPQKPRARIKN